jgi:hypothetical protein
MLALFPALPVPLDLLLGYALVIPLMSSPAMIPEIIPPPRRYPGIKGWNPLIVGPARVIAIRTIPAPVPQTPPPAVVEKHVRVYVRDGIDIGFRQDYHLGRCGKYDGWRQGDADAHINPGHHGKR